MQKTIKVEYKVFSTLFAIKRELKRIEATYTEVSFDIETRSIYDKENRKLAKEVNHDVIDIEEENTLSLITNASGLSHPSIVRTTHVILGLSTDESVVFVIDDKLEQFLFDWLVNTDLKIIIHNATFDLKMVHHRTGKFPKDFEDTQQLAKSIINDCNNYHSRTGLKLLVGKYFPPKWAMKEDTDYEVANLKDEDFLLYCAIDGAATLLLYRLLKDTINEKEEE